MSKKKEQRSEGGISRREFARSAMLTATVAALPAAVLAQSPTTAQEPGPASPAPPLPPAAQAEAERAWQAILAKYGDRFTDAQKSDLRRLVLQQQKSLEILRAFSLDNSDQPVTVLHLPTAGRR